MLVLPTAPDVTMEPSYNPLFSYDTWHEGRLIARPDQTVIEWTQTASLRVWVTWSAQLFPSLDRLQAMVGGINEWTLNTELSQLSGCCCTFAYVTMDNWMQVGCSRAKHLLSGMSLKLHTLPKIFLIRHTDSKKTHITHIFPYTIHKARFYFHLILVHILYSLCVAITHTIPVWRWGGFSRTRKLLEVHAGLRAHCQGALQLEDSARESSRASSS